MSQARYRFGPNPFTVLRIPKIFNLLTDPDERADITSNTDYDWMDDHTYLLTPAQTRVAQALETLQAFPLRQKAASFRMRDVIEKMSSTLRSS